MLAIFPLGLSEPIFAANLTARSVAISNSTPGANTTQKIKFTIPSVSNIGSIRFEYCTNSPSLSDTCSAPAGFSASSASLTNQTGETGFIISPTSTANKIILTRPSVPNSAVPVSYTFANITNPSATNSTVYVRIATFPSINASGSFTDEGSVAFSTAANLSVTGYVPPYLTFCTGVTVALNCSSTQGSFLNFGELVTSQPRFLSSQFSVATNDPGGYSTTVSGPTMTSGNNPINAMSSPAPSQAGSSQFGMNLRANTNPPVGSDPAGVGSGAIAAGFNTPNQFYFKNQVATSAVNSTDFNAFTVSYIVNVGGNQPPGIYSTTLTYIASAAF